MLAELVAVMPAVPPPLEGLEATTAGGDGDGDGNGDGDGDGNGDGDVDGSCAWILKSVDMSRGRGITLSDDVHVILKRCVSKEYRCAARESLSMTLWPVLRP